MESISPLPLPQFGPILEGKAAQKITITKHIENSSPKKSLKH
jgi:hypothetical protein